MNIKKVNVVLISFILFSYMFSGLNIVHSIPYERWYNNKVLNFSRPYTENIFFEDDISVLTEYYNCTITEEESLVKSGSISANISIGSSQGNVYYFPIDYDFSSYESISFWLYGNYSSEVLRLNLVDGYGNYFQYVFIDNFVGWEYFNLYFADLDEISVTVPTSEPDIEDIEYIEFIFESDSDSTYFLDYLILIHNWVDEECNGLQVNFNINYNNSDNGLNFNCKEDFSDLRFFDYESDNLLPAYNQSQINGNYINIWLKLESLNVTLRYNNPDATSYWDINNTFNTVIYNAIISNPMLEGEGSTTHDYSGYGNDATLYNTNWVNDSPFDETAIHVNMTSSQISYGYDSSYLNMNKTFSFFYWIYFDDFELNNGWGFVHSGVGGWYNYLSANPNQNIRTYFLDNVTYRLTVTGDIYEQEWIFYSARYNISDKMSSFRNGEPSYYNASTTSYPHNSTNQISWSGNNALNATVCLTFLTSDYITDEQEIILYDSYPDMRVLNGSCCARTWVKEMPSVVFGIEFSTLFSDSVLIGSLGLVVALCALLLIITKKK